MTDDLVKRLRAKHNDTWPLKIGHGDPINEDGPEAADRIETLESVMQDDARWLAAYHKWCEINGCAPSSSDLIAAREALEGKND